MAKQNFLSGGYYGKLGVTVGQRWKNIRTIRSYVIPANPRTAKQQANRGQFGGAVSKSQLAMQMNYNATCFEHSDFSKWNYRMKTARELQDNAMLDLDLLPLYPTTFVPPFLITKMEIENTATPKSIVFAVEGQMPTTDRVLSVLFHLYDENNSEVGYKLYIGSYEIANPNKITVEVDDNEEINENCLVRLVSRDDTDSETDMVASGMLQVEGGTIIERDFNTEVLSISKELDKVTVVFNEPFKAFVSANFTGSVYGVSAGAYVTVNGSALTLINSGGYFAVEIPCDFVNTQQILAFPEGCSVTVTSIYVEGARFIYTKQNDVVTFSDTDLTRTLNNYTEITDDSYNTVVLQWVMGDISTLSNQDVVCVLKSSLNPGATNGVQTSFTLGKYDSTTLQLYTNDNRRVFAMRSGDWVSYPNMSFIMNGVTYNIPGETQKAFVNTRTSSYLTPTNTPHTLDCSHSYSGGDYQASVVLSFTYWQITNPEDISFATSTEAFIYTATTPLMADIDNYGSTETLEILITASYSSNLGTPTKFTLNSPTTRAFTYNGINYFFNFSNVTWEE